MIRKTIFLAAAFILCTCLVNASQIRIGRDKTLVKDGPGSYYNTLLVLKMGTPVDYIKESADDPGWAQITYN